MEKLVLNFTIQNQTLQIDNPYIRLVENSVNYLRAKFDFTQDWNGLYKVAIFENKGTIFAVHIDKEDLYEDGTLDVPFGVIKTPGFRVSCFGTEERLSIDSEGNLNCPEVLTRITTNVVGVGLEISGPLQGIVPPATSKELNVYEISNLALTIAKEAQAMAKEAYSIVSNMQQTLKEENELSNSDTNETKYTF